MIRKFLTGIIIPFVILLLWGCRQTSRDPEYTVIRGGTLVDVNNLGKSGNDITNSYILVKGDRIVESGSLDKAKIPRNSRIIDADGGFIIPGLIDGFATLNNQAYANAYLYMGVTSIIEVDGGRRGDYYPGADPHPDIYRLESVGDDRKSTEAHLADLTELYQKGYKVALLKYGLDPGQVKAVMDSAHVLGMGCIGELGHTTYKEAAAMGLGAFVHTTRYSLDIAPRDMAAAVADQPFSDDMNSPKWKYYQFLYSLKPDDPDLLDHARVLGESGTFLIPTISLLYLDLPEHENPWNYPVAKILHPKDINAPANRETGNHEYTPEVQKNYTAIAKQEYMIESTYLHHGARYLAGSATDVWGTMPGISSHTEIRLLHKIGLSNREALAAATTNFNQAFGWKTGKIEKGFTANILVLDKNPVEDLRHLESIRTLIYRGKEIDRASLIK